MGLSPKPLRSARTLRVSVKLNGIAGHKVGVQESETSYENSFTPSPVQDFQAKQVLV